ncbi:AAA family ATPase [Streptomyces sp. NPDC018057]|uniref:AAA family ATPase n=1 Tax=unclassified Streptomyces TaxID=2593676 RepID=UPI0037BDF241
MLLVGITGSGKTVLAQTLAARGMVRLSVDEEVHRLHGRYGVDYPEHEYFEREGPVVDAVRQQLADELAAGHDVVLDHGLWLRGDRDAWKKTIEAAGGRWALVYLPVEKAELLRRLNERNQRADANALTVIRGPGRLLRPLRGSGPRRGRDQRRQTGRGTVGAVISAPTRSRPPRPTRAPGHRR